jgi:hypothetical protein
LGLRSDVGGPPDGPVPFILATYIYFHLEQNGGLRPARPSHKQIEATSTTAVDSGTYGRGDAVTLGR